MTTKNLRNFFVLPAVAVAAVGFSVWSQVHYTPLEASSHREAPLIADDPLADNTDLYAFRAPNDPSRVVLIANYIPFELPHGGPNYYTFGEHIRYEVHVKNDPATPGDDITYRFTFTRSNDDPTTFFNIRLNQQNLKTTYICEKITAGGTTTIVPNGVVPPNNIGPRSIENGTVGLGAPNYESLRTSAIANAVGGGGETIYCGPADDPFFADLGAIFDLAGLRPANAEDGLSRKNVHSIVISVPIATLQRDGKTTAQATDILDPDFVVGVWASASRQQLLTLTNTGQQNASGTWVQVSRLGMPLTNEVINPIGSKDRWNALTPYTEDAITDDYMSNPELGLYVDTRFFASAVPGLNSLRIQKNSLGAYDFGNTHDGLFPLKGNAALNGTALADAAFGNYLLRDNKPRSVDILPIFHTGVPNLRPYQLATGKPAGNPLAAGKPFVNNFLPLTAPGRTNPGGDMLRLNMAVPVTARNSPDFSNDGLLAAAVLGLTDSRFNQNASLQAIPNMDGFPNGRRLEDAVDKIELKAVGGIVLAAIGLWYDDYVIGQSPLTPQLLKTVTFTTGLEKNDTTIRASFPYVQTPWRGTGSASGPTNVLMEQDLVVSTPMSVSGGTYRNVTVTATGKATLTGPLQVTGTLAVQTGGELITGCQPITGSGKVVVAAAATLHVCDPAGLTLAGNTSAGTLRNSGLRTLSGDATYVYDGTTAQVTGPGLPATVATLEVDNESGVTLTKATSVRQVLRLTDGTFSLGGQSLTLLSSIAGTAMVVNVSGTVSGTATVQRYISAESNPGPGYRHLSSPTTASPVSDLTTGGFTPRVNPAYNALPMPMLTVDQFPNVFGYDETRGGAAVSDFNVGYYSPNSLADILTPGRGYAVNMKGGLRPDFMGTLTQQSLTIPGLTRTGNNLGNEEKSGWHLLGNPFPSPLDWDLVPVPAGLSSSISVFKSTGQNSGVYLTRANGMGTLPNGLLPLAQGFFARVTGTGPIALTLPNSARPTTFTYTDPVHYRGASVDTRPVVSLKLNASGNAVADETVVYFQAGATAGLDDQFDGQKPQHNLGTAPTLLSMASGNQELAVNGMPALVLTTGTTIPLLFDVRAAGSYQFTVGQWANLTGTDVTLIDRQLNTVTPLTAGTTYSFRATAGTDVTRFALGFAPTGRVTGLTSQVAAPALVLWPNPASGKVQLGGAVANTSVVVLDATGRAVLKLRTDATGAALMDLSSMPKGVYIVRVGTQTQRLVVE